MGDVRTAEENFNRFATLPVAAVSLRTARCVSGVTVSAFYFVAVNAECHKIRKPILILNRIPTFLSFRYQAVTHADSTVPISVRHGRAVC